MKFRSLLILVIILGALAALVFKTRQNAQSSASSESGQRVLKIDDINNVAKIEITSGKEHVVLLRTNDRWTVETLWNYPAQFDQLASTLRTLDLLRIGEVIRGGAATLDEFGLADSDSSFPAHLKLFDASGALTDEITIGQPRISQAMNMGFSAPDSRYIQIGKGEVVLAEPFMNDVRRRPSDWIESNLPHYGPGDIASMSAEPTNGKPYSVTRLGENEYAGGGALKKKTISVESAELWFRAFQSLSTRTIIEPDTPPDVLDRGSGGSVTALLTNGIVVRADIGARSEKTMGHYGWLTFSYNAPPLLESTDTNALAADAEARATAEKESKRLQERYEPWIYIFDYGQAAKFMIAPERLTETNAPATK